MECCHLSALKAHWKGQLLKLGGTQGDQADSAIQTEKQILTALEKFS